MADLQSNSGDKLIPDEELLSTTEKRPRIEEEDGSEKEPKLVAQPVDVEPKQETRFPPGRIYTYEDWKRDMKTSCCNICNKVGHYESDCEWTEVCPTSAVVPSFVEKVCWCCGEPPEINHHGEEFVALRAQFKISRPLTSWEKLKSFYMGIWLPDALTVNLFLHGDMG